MAQSVKPLTLDFGSNCDLRIVRRSVTLGSVLSAESVLSLLPLTLLLRFPSLSLK